MVLTIPGGLADVCVSENHVWSLLLHKVILSLENFGKTLRKNNFVLQNDAQKHKGFVGFENAFCATTYVVLTALKLRSFLCTFLLMTSIFVTPRIY